MVKRINRGDGHPIDNQPPPSKRPRPNPPNDDQQIHARDAAPHPAPLAMELQPPQRRVLVRQMGVDPRQPPFHVRFDEAGNIRPQNEQIQALVEFWGIDFHDPAQGQARLEAELVIREGKEIDPMYQR